VTPGLRIGLKSWLRSRRWITWTDTIPVRWLRASSDRRRRNAADQGASAIHPQRRVSFGVRFVSASTPNFVNRHGL